MLIQKICLTKNKDLQGTLQKLNSQARQYAIKESKEGFNKCSIGSDYFLAIEKVINIE
jgi:hypothetical protein